VRCPTWFTTSSISSQSKLSIDIGAWLRFKQARAIEQYITMFKMNGCSRKRTRLDNVVQRRPSVRTLASPACDRGNVAVSYFSTRLERLAPVASQPFATRVIVCESLRQGQAFASPIELDLSASASTCSS
jgi:hypothetical protein